MSIERTRANIIDKQTFDKLNNVKNKTLVSVVCYLWINQINPREPISIIHAIEFNFSDGDKLILSGNESQEGLVNIEYSFEEEKKVLEKEFGEKLKLFKVLANNTEMWKDVINTRLVNFNLTKDKTTNEYLSDEIVLEFENKEMRLVQVHPLDGVILDYYEEV